jgi:hypothetical protein
MRRWVLGDCRPPVVPTPRRQIPEELERLRVLQLKNGQWKVCAEVHHCLGDVVPDPPEGVSEGRWLTALCVAFIKCVARLLASVPAVACLCGVTVRCQPAAVRCLCGRPSQRVVSSPPDGTLTSGRRWRTQWSER